MLFSGTFSLASVIVPPTCLSCGIRVGSPSALCGPCWNAVEFIRDPVCARLGLPMPYDAGPDAISAAAAADPPEYGRARAVARYSGTVADLIRDFKFHDRHDMRPLLGRWLVEAGRELLARPDALIVPVPMTWFALVSRRFNQAAILAREAARLSGTAVDTQALVRRKRTARQVGLTRQRRADNVRGAFAVPLKRRRRIEGRHIVLVDDVITTGATVRSCARALLSAGAHTVDVLAVALVTDAAV